MVNDPEVTALKKLVLIGGGGHCKSVLDAALRMNEYEEIVITDPIIEPGMQVLGCSVVGSDDFLIQLHQNGFDYAFITVGNVSIEPLREKLANKVESLGFKFPVIQDPSAIVADSAAIAEGTFIGKNVVINADANIGRHCIINTGAILEHECTVGDFVHVSVGAILCGEVEIGNNCMIGAGSTVIQCTKIGNHTIVGAGAVVNKNLPDQCKAAGVPARII